MNSPAFFRSAEVVALLEKAARFAAMPVCIHPFGVGEEGLRLVGVGQCEVCRFVGSLRGGRKACARSREGAATTAVRCKTPVPFICHAGLACLTLPALSCDDATFVLTVGPYCPSEGAAGFKEEVCAALGALGADEEAIPALDDIHRAPASVAPAVGDWVRSELARLWSAYCAVPVEADATATDPAPTVKRREARYAGAAFGAEPITLSLASGSTTQTRLLVRSSLADTEGRGKARMNRLRARALALAGAVIEVAGEARLDVRSAWDGLPALAASLQAARDEPEVVDLLMRLLQTLEPRAEAPGQADYAELSALLSAHLVDGITLNEVAARLGVSPSALTHRLKRNFGMTFSEYFNRLRLNKAKELLRRTKLTVAEVSRRVGIADGSNLGKLFRKFEGMSPQEYRARFGGGE